MKISIQNVEGVGYTIIAKRTLPSEQVLAGVTEVPREDVPDATLQVVNEMRGEMPPPKPRKWRPRAR